MECRISRLLEPTTFTMYRDIFKKFKGSFDRIFITGVSPVTLDGVTSGFNIGWHISTKEEFNQMLGFSTEDVRDMFTYYKDNGKIRPDSDIEAERNLQGFFMAYLSLNSYYYTAPELELSHGYCDFFLLPDLTHYPTKHSYILELKLIPKKEKGMAKKTHDRLIAEQWHEAEELIRRYASAPRAEALRQGTELHRIIMQFNGWKLYRMGEV